MRTIAFKLGLANLLPLAMLIILAVLAVVDKKTDLMAERKLKTRHLVEAAYGVLTHYQQLERKINYNNGNTVDELLRTFTGVYAFDCACYPCEKSSWFFQYAGSCINVYVPHRFFCRHWFRVRYEILN